MLWQKYRNAPFMSNYTWTWRTEPLQDLGGFPGLSYGVIGRMSDGK